MNTNTETKGSGVDAEVKSSPLLAKWIARWEKEEAAYWAVSEKTDEEIASTMKDSDWEHDEDKSLAIKLYRAKMEGRWIQVSNMLEWLRSLNG